MPRLHAQSQRPNRSRNQHFPRRGFSRLARDFHAARIQSLHFIAQPQRGQLKPVRPKRIRLDNLRARFDIRLVHAKHRLRLRRVQLVETPLRPHRLMQQRPHGAIRDENRILQPLVKILDLQWSRFLSVGFTRRRSSSHARRSQPHPQVSAQDPLGWPIIRAFCEGWVAPSTPPDRAASCCFQSGILPKARSSVCTLAP